MTFASCEAYFLCGCSHVVVGSSVTHKFEKLLLSFIAAIKVKSVARDVNDQMMRVKVNSQASLSNYLNISRSSLM